MATNIICRAFLTFPQTKKLLAVFLFKLKLSGLWIFQFKFDNIVIDLEL